MSNFPVVSPNFKLLDFGNITCEDQNLEKLKKILPKKFQ
jgi:formiminoglutamase